MFWGFNRTVFCYMQAGENLSLGVEELFELLKDDNGDGDADQPQSGIVDDKVWQKTEVYRDVLLSGTPVLK